MDPQAFSQTLAGIQGLPTLVVGHYETAHPCAMEAAVENQVWSIEEIVELLGEDANMVPKKRPERHPDAFVLVSRVNGQEMKAVCEVWQDDSGWEARLVIAGRYVLASTVVPTVLAIMETTVRWQAAMTALGWHE